MNTSEDVKRELDSLTENIADILTLTKDSKNRIKFGFAY